MALPYLVTNLGPTLGKGSTATAQGSVAIGSTLGNADGTIPAEHVAAATAINAVQIGGGMNSTPNTIQYRGNTVPTIIVAGVAPGALAPDFIGQLYLNTAGAAGTTLYVGKTTSASGFAIV